MSSVYSFDFSTFESGVVTVSGEQLQDMEEAVMVMSYNSVDKVGMFVA